MIIKADQLLSAIRKLSETAPAEAGKWHRALATRFPTSCRSRRPAQMIDGATYTS